MVTVRLNTLITPTAVLIASQSVWCDFRFLGHFQVGKVRTERTQQRATRSCAPPCAAFCVWCQGVAKRAHVRTGILGKRVPLKKFKVPVRTCAVAVSPSPA